MGEIRERGVLATEAGVQKLQDAKASKRNSDDKHWTYADIAEVAGVTDKTVGRFFRREQPIDESSARAICQALLVDASLVIDFNTPPISEDRKGQLSSNPFNYGSPVPPELFYGRQRTIADVKNRIGAVTAQCINIVGLRRSGKTSLLNYIQERPEVFFHESQKPLIVKLDIQDARFHTPEGMIEGLRRGIHKHTGMSPWSPSDDDDPYEVEDGLIKIREQGYRLIVMLDELELIGTRLEQFQDWGEDWRAKVSAGLFALVIACKRPLSEVYNSLNLTSPFSNIFSTTILGALEEDVWQKLVQDGFAPKTLNAKILNLIDDLAGGLPYYVQLAAAMLWQHDDPEQARQEFIFQATPRFKELWNSLHDTERQALRFAAGITRSTAPPTQAMTNILQRHGLLRTDGRNFSNAFEEFMREQ